MKLRHENEGSADSWDGSIGIGLSLAACLRRVLGKVAGCITARMRAKSKKMK